jgi:hypothetical protein
MGKSKNTAKTAHYSSSGTKPHAPAGGFAPVKGTVLGKGLKKGKNHRRNSRYAMCIGGAMGGLVGLTFISLLSFTYPEDITAAVALFLSAGFTTIGLMVGAHVDLNRYFLVKLRDNKALCFKSVMSVSKHRHQPPPTPKQTIDTNREMVDSAITTVVYENLDNHPHADTFRRDKVLASAKQALLSMDHTKQIRH